MRALIASFSHHIFRVFFGGAKKQVVWINTCRNIALMTSKQVIRYFAHMNLIGKSVRPDGLPVVPKHTIPKVGGAASPQPAGIRFVDVEPEPLNIRHVSGWANRPAGPLSEVVLVAKTFGQSNAIAFAVAAFLFWCAVLPSVGVVFGVILFVVTFLALAFGVYVGRTTCRANHNGEPSGISVIIA